MQRPEVLGAFAELAKVQLPALGAELPKVGRKLSKLSEVTFEFWRINGEIS